MEVIEHDDIYMSEAGSFTMRQWLSTYSRRDPVFDFARLFPRLPLTLLVAARQWYPGGEDLL